MTAGLKRLKLRKFETFAKNVKWVVKKGLLEPLALYFSHLKVNLRWLNQGRGESYQLKLKASADTVSLTLTVIILDITKSSLH